MSKRKVGSKQNAILNMEWGIHVRGWLKRLTSSKRRMVSKKILRKEIAALE